MINICILVLGQAAVVKQASHWQSMKPEGTESLSGIMLNAEPDSVLWGVSNDGSS